MSRRGGRWLCPICKRREYHLDVMAIHSLMDHAEDEIGHFARMGAKAAAQPTSARDISLSRLDFDLIQHFASTVDTYEAGVR